MAYFSSTSEVCATCEHWLGGRKFVNHGDATNIVNTFQNFGLCIEQQVEREVMTSCQNFTLWSALNR